MKKHIIIDDNGLSGYGIIESFGDIYSVTALVDPPAENRSISRIEAVLLNGSATFSLGSATLTSQGLSVKAFFKKEDFATFDPSLPTKIRFSIILNENALTYPQHKATQNKKTDAFGNVLSKYLRQYDLFCDKEYSQIAWYRVHDGQILLDDDNTKQLFENCALINILSVLKHYLIGFGENGEVYYAFPARFGVEQNPFLNKKIRSIWKPVFGQSEKFGDFGYYILSHTG